MSELLDVVDFNPVTFRATFFGDFDAPAYPDELLQACFNRACRQISNEPGAKIPWKKRGFILDAATAHIAFMGKNRPAALGGQITSANQGPTTVSTSASAVPFTAQWWMLTSYGAECWGASAPWRGCQWVSPE